ncbi:MAG: hypothetical protein JOZ73_08705, partial [Solirubrobacterales bacterium]|nr:hypothetical protein [Solirubrobacterales bacterium]
LTGSSVNNNIATVTDNDGVHGGGGIHVEGAHSTVIDIVVAGASQVSNNNFTANGGTEDASNCCSGGGAIYQDSSTTTISDSRLSGNTATVNSGACCHGGGAVFDDAGGGTITRSNVSSNTSTVNGPAGGTGNSHCCLGGGALNTVGGWTLTSSTMDSNTSSVSAGECCHGGGAVQQDSDTHPLHVNGSTISRNSAEFNQAAGPTSSGGGAVYEDQGTANNTYTNSTISNNSTNVSGLVAQGGGGIYVFANTTNTDQLANVTMARNSAQTALGGGIYNLRSKVDSRNSIVALNTAGLDANCYGTSSPVITSLGYNLEDSANTCGFSATGDKVVPAAAVGLGPLANNGGPTQTQALLSGSAAVDAGNPAGCTSPSGAPLTTDQRGFPRPSGPRCDIGAYELQANNPLPSAAKCTLKSKSNKVLVRKPKKGKHKKAKVGVLTLKIRCNQGASLKLTGKVVEQLRKKKGKHRKRTKTFKLRRVTRNGGANQTITITLKLPKGALNALKHGARESVMLTLTASNGNGTRKTTLKIKRLRARKR